ncbi:MAG: NUDIX domain-containing protein [Phenylobacterium sp.]|jgi:8-oxo-dGTP diphosphatase
MRDIQDASAWFKIGDGLIGERFDGTKLALFHEGRLLVYQRDIRPDLRFSGLWDLPGGGREGDETPVACGLRELQEEFGISLPLTQLEWIRAYHPAGARGAQVFIVGVLRAEQIGAIQFGSEGRQWRLIDAEAFATLADAVPQLRTRVADALAAGLAPRHRDQASAVSNPP